MNDPVLSMEGIYKEFPGVVAVNNVDLSLHKGEVLALIGENGAGKSSLMKILGGSYISNAGRITIEGKEVNITSPSISLSLGISVIYQELNYCDKMSIAENIMLGQVPVSGPFKQVDYKMLRERSMEIQKVIGLDDVDPFEPLSTLSIGQKQLVEIGKAYARKTKILIMDEPTSALNDREVSILFKLVEKLKAEGLGIIYISHKLDEVMQLSDRVQIMRDGISIGTYDIKSITKEQMVSKMVGRTLSDMYPVKPRTLGDELLRVEHLYTNYLKDINFSVRKGEILGLYGLMGAGCEDILQCLFGVQKKAYGDIFLENKKIIIETCKDGVKNKLAYVPGERKTEGLILQYNILDNMSVASLDHLKKPLGIDRKKELKEVSQWAERLNIKTVDLNVPVEKLSGGNQQKVIIGKWLMTAPKVLLLNDPTKGVDVGAKVEIYKLMENFCEQGMCVLFFSSEMAEIINIVDRVLVMHEGRVSAAYNKSEFTQENIMRSAIGG